MTFEPSEQVLADRVSFHSKDKQDMGGVRVACLLDGGKEEEIGFLNLVNGETMTVGWNCEMTSAEIRIPRIAVGLVESRTSDNPEIRARRGLKEFSIMALNGANEETFGFSRYMSQNPTGYLKRFLRTIQEDREDPPRGS